MTSRKPCTLVRFWRRLSLHNKLVFMFSSMFFILLVFVFTIVHSTFNYQQEFQKALLSHYRINNFLAELQVHNALFSNFTRNEDISVLLMQESHKKLQTILGEIRQENHLSQAAYFEIQALENALTVYIEKTQQTITQKWSGSPYYQEFYSGVRIRDYMNMYLSNLQNILLSEGNQRYEILSARSKKTQQILIIVAVGISIVIMRFVFVFSRRFTDPIKKIASLSQRIADGELDVPLMTQREFYGKEISVLADSFNKMSRNIKAMVDDITKKSLQEKKWHESELERESALASLREAQLISLQSQIKPHFLFNTLNTIARQAELEAATQTVSLIQSLARLLRYNLVSHQQAVPLDQELLAVSEYVNLQKKRFGDRICYKCRCSVDASLILFPPLVIQTFVENAIYHGIEPLIDGGLVLVDICRKKNSIVIRILDTGVGMDSEKCATLYTPQDHGVVKSLDGAVHGIGIRNVLTRLHLYYRGQEKISIYSKKNRGTLIVMMIPAEKDV